MAIETPENTTTTNYQPLIDELVTTYTAAYHEREARARQMNEENEQQKYQARINECQAFLITAFPRSVREALQIRPDISHNRAGYTTRFEFTVDGKTWEGDLENRHDGIVVHRIEAPDGITRQRQADENYDFIFTQIGLWREREATRQENAARAQQAWEESLKPATEPEPPADPRMVTMDAHRQIYGFVLQEAAHGSYGSALVQQTWAIFDQYGIEFKHVSSEKPGKPFKLTMDEYQQLQRAHDLYAEQIRKLNEEKAKAQDDDDDIPF